ncbi:MAG: hypothetical protein JXR83_22690 [Deltaproteobacteria bacterium]|nr:hypothetical protein [Deltaproteobacteria bacterium]
MRALFDIASDDTAPQVEQVLQAQGVPGGGGRSRSPDDAPRRERARQLALQAISLYCEQAVPRGLFDELTADAFEPLLRPGEIGDSPLRQIYPDAGALALYAVTVGEPVSELIGRLFDADDFALASMLDTAASHGAELAAQAIKARWREHLLATGRLQPTTGIMEFSPGYCGWEVTAQQPLFARLRPAEIGIALNSSFLMQPLKSVSGVLVAGDKEIFMFDPEFECCRGCQARTCVDRINSLVAESGLD